MGALSRSSTVLALPPGTPADLRLVWNALCPPVRQRYAREQAPNRAREAMLRLLRWEARRRLARLAPPWDAGTRPPTPSAQSSISVHRSPPADSPIPFPSPPSALKPAPRFQPALPPDARILALRPDNLGDALLTTPAWTLLKETLPGAHLTVLASPAAADVAAHCPAVDRVRECRFPGFGAALAGESSLSKRVVRGLAPYRLLFDTAAQLAEEEYDLAIVFRPDHWWGAALVALAGIPYRAGFDTPEGGAFLSQSLPLERLPVGAAARAVPRPHAAAQSLTLARAALTAAGWPPPGSFDERMRYEPAPEDRADAVRLWHANDLDNAPAVVALHPAPGAPVKRWDARRFAAVADHLAGRYGCKVVITGASSDDLEARAVATACRRVPVVLAGQTSFGALAALLERCRFAIGTDNGAMHLAIARGVPTLRLFGPVDPAVWAPWPPDQPVPHLALATSLACSPCHRLDVPPWETASGGETAYPCLQDVTVEQAIAAAEALWARTANRLPSST